MYLRGMPTKFLIKLDDSIINIIIHNKHFDFKVTQIFWDYFYSINLISYNKLNIVCRT